MSWNISRARREIINFTQLYKILIERGKLLFFFCSIEILELIIIIARQAYINIYITREKSQKSTWRESRVGAIKMKECEKEKGR